MALLEQDHAFEIAEAVIAASEADETEVSIECVEDRFLRYAHEGPTQSADRERYEVAVRVRLGAEGAGFQEARATCGGLDEASVFGALARAQTLARIAGVDPDAVPLGGQAPAGREVPGTSPSRPTQDHSFREKGEWVAEALGQAEAAGLRASGLARTTVASRSLVNSAGRRVHGATSRAEFSVTCADHGDHAETVGGAAASATSQVYVDEVDAAAVAADAVRAAVAGRDPRPVGPGPRDVVLAPQAVAALLTFAGAYGFGAREVALGQSFMAGRAGDALFDPALRILDDPGHAAHRGWLFDGEGTRTSPTVLVDGGRVMSPVTDGRWGRRLGLENTGHGVPQPSAEGPRPRALVLEPGQASMDDLVAAVGDGLLVRQLHYVNVVEPRELVLTGMTRGGLFRIAGGEVAGPVANLRFTESLVGALRRIVAVGDRAERCGSLMGREVVAPAIALRGFTFTSEGR